MKGVAMYRYTRQGAPDNHTQDAPRANMPGNSIALEASVLLAALAVMCALCAAVWLVAVPEADARVADARAAYEATMGGAADA